MTVYYRVDREGGFTVLDTQGVSHYQHPGTVQAKQAANAPWRVAVELLDEQQYARTRSDMPRDPAAYTDYDRENARRIEEGRRDGSTCELNEPVARIERDVHERDHARPGSVAQEMLAEAKAELEIIPPGVELDYGHDDDHSRERW